MTARKTLISIWKKHECEIDTTFIEKVVYPSMEAYAEHQNKELIEAMQEFIDRVEKGEVRSKYTYNKFKELIKTNKS